MRTSYTICGQGKLLSQTTVNLIYTCTQRVMMGPKISPLPDPKTE